MTSILNEVRQHHQRVVEHLRPGQTALFTGLYGSQNYGTATSQSDVDTKTIVLPSFEDLVMGNSNFAYELRMPDGSLCNVLSLQSLGRNLIKGSINFVELLFTDYVVIAEEGQEIYGWLKQQREVLARVNPNGALHACMGHLMRNHHVYLKHDTNENKAVANIVRLSKFMQSYASNLMPYKKLLSANAAVIKNIRNGNADIPNYSLVSTYLNTAEQYVNACLGLGENTSLMEELQQQIIRAHRKVIVS